MNEKTTVENMYTRLLHYADVMKYENKPNQNPEKYNEARRLIEKLGGYISENHFRLMAEECEIWLSEYDTNSTKYDRDYFDDDRIRQREEGRGEE